MNPIEQHQQNMAIIRSSNGGKGNWFTRTFDPKGQEMYFNSAEAKANRDFQSVEAEKNRQFNSAEAKANRDFQLEMSNTAYQRAVGDMERAGLNPYLAYSAGGASTPVGSSASYSSTPAGSSASVSLGSNGQILNNIVTLATSAVRLAKKVISK